MQEMKNQMNQYMKGSQGNNYTQKDFSEDIYADERNANNFVEN